MLNRRHILGALLVMIISFAGLLAAKTFDEPAPLTPSQLSVRLADWQDLTPRDRDFLLTEDLADWTTVHRRRVVNVFAQKQCLAEAVYYEARSETLAGQKAVAEVVMNRAKSKHYPNTVCGVVYQGAERRSGCQFSFTCDGSMARTPSGKYWRRSKEVAALAMTDGYAAVTKRATHYHTTAVNPYWSKKLKKTDQYGTHVFYRFKNRRELREGTSTINLAPPPT